MEVRQGRIAAQCANNQRSLAKAVAKSKGNLVIDAASDDVRSQARIRQRAIDVVDQIIQRGVARIALDKDGDRGGVANLQTEGCVRAQLPVGRTISARDEQS